MSYFHRTPSGRCIAEHRRTVSDSKISIGAGRPLPSDNFCCASSQCCGTWAPGATTAQPSIAAWISAVTRKTDWGIQHVPECTGSKVRVLHGFTHCYTEHIRTSQHTSMSIDSTITVGSMWADLGRFVASEPGQEGSRPIFIWHLWQSKVLGKGCHGMALGQMSGI